MVTGHDVVEFEQLLLCSNTMRKVMVHPYQIGLVLLSPAVVQSSDDDEYL